MGSALHDLGAEAGSTANDSGPLTVLRRSAGALRKPLLSLRTRILVFVVSATLATALAVTGVSVHLVQEFVNNKVQKELGDELDVTAARVETWFKSRLNEIQVFAESAVLHESLFTDTYDRVHVDQYLTNVASNLPDLVAIFVLDTAGRVTGWAGDRLTLPPALLLSLSNLQLARISDIVSVESAQIHVVSAPIRKLGPPVGTLHAVFKAESLLPLLKAEGLSDSGRLVLVDVRSEVVVDTPPVDPLNYPLSDIGTLDDIAALMAYRNANGDKVIGAGRFIPASRQLLLLEESYHRVFDPVAQILHKSLVINLSIVLVFGLGAILVARSIVRPIGTLARKVQSLAEGKPDAAIWDAADNEVGMLAEAINATVARFESRTERLEHLSKTDGLTGVYNQRAFKQALKDEAVKAKASAEPLSLVLVDIDHFKDWNDRYGHERGDTVLRVVAKLISRTIRGSDLLARYGGDEFVVLARNTNLAGARVLAEKLCAAASNLVDKPAGTDTMTLSVSVGISEFTGDVTKFFADADRGLYAAKRAGRNCVRRG